MKTLALLPLALLSTAALAQEYPPPPPPYDERDAAPPRDPQDYRDADADRADAGGYADHRESVDPSTARAVAGAVQAVTDAILDVRIDGVRRAADPSARDGGARTVGDLMARRDPDYRQHIHQDMARAARTAAGAARTATAVQSAADDFAHRIEDAIAAAGY